MKSPVQPVYLKTPVQKPIRKAAFLLAALAATLSPAQGPRMTLADINRSLNLIRTQVESGEKWSTISGKYTHLYWVKSASLKPAKAKSISELMDSCLAFDCHALSIPVPSKGFPIYLYPDNASLSQALGRSFPGGLSLGNWAVIIMPQDGSLSTLGPQCAHEIGHGLVHTNLGTFGCALFAEGIAFYLQARYSHAAWLKHPAPVETTPLTTLVDTITSPRDYEEGSRFCGYLMTLDHDKPTRIKQMLNGLNGQRVKELGGVGNALPWRDRVDRVFTKVYNQPLAAMEASWRKSFRR